MQACNTYKNKHFSILGDSLSTLWGYSVPAFTFPFCRGGIHLEKYCEAVKACAEKHQCRLIDLYDTENLFDTVDCYPPNADGMKTISAAIIKRLEQEETYK